MSLSEERLRAEKYDFISGLHGGYSRFDFVDHAYLYNLYFPPEDFFDKLKDRIHQLVLNYPVAQSELAELLSANIHQAAANIVVGNGAAELIKIVCSRVARQVILPVPSFNEYANAAPAGQCFEYPLDFPSFTLDVDAFAAEAKRIGADVAVVVSPNNPTGLLVPKDHLIQLAKKLAACDCMLIVDESFLDFSAKAEAYSLENEIDKYKNIAIFKSLSKAYGICGLRLGYMLSANKAFTQAVRDGLHIWNINGFAEEFLRLLPDYKREFKESCQKVIRDREVLFTQLSKLQGLNVYPSDANYLYCQLDDSMPSGPSIAKDMFVKHNLFIKHCAGKTQPQADRFLRIASRTKAENSRLTAALQDVLSGGVN